MTKYKKIEQTAPKEKESSLCNGIVSTDRNSEFWLVKLPSTLASKWANADPSTELGKIVITNEGGKQVGKVKDIDGEMYEMASVNAQRLFVMEKKEDKINIAGFVKSMYQLTPTNLDAAFSRARTITKISNTVLRKTQPIMMKGSERLQKLDIQIRNQQAKTAEEKRMEKLIKEREKAVKSDRDVVMSKILQMFEKQEYISFNEIKKATNQPEDYLREILNQVAKYISSGEHIKKWQLKEDYRHKVPQQDTEEWE